MLNGLWRAVLNADFYIENIPVHRKSNTEQLVSQWRMLLMDAPQYSQCSTSTNITQPIKLQTLGLLFQHKGYSLPCNLLTSSPSSWPMSVGQMHEGRVQQTRLIWFAFFDLPHLGPAAQFSTGTAVTILLQIASGFCSIAGYHWKSKPGQR